MQMPLLPPLEQGAGGAGGRKQQLRHTGLCAFTGAFTSPALRYSRGEVFVWGAGGRKGGSNMQPPQAVPCAPVERGGGHAASKTHRPLCIHAWVGHTYSSHTHRAGGLSPAPHQSAGSPSCQLGPAGRPAHAQPAQWGCCGQKMPRPAQHSTARHSMRQQQRQ